jgi:valyl-tRNA synthetase
MLDKTFNPKEVEGRIYAQWEASGAFRAGQKPGAEPYCIVIPPPNVTGRLHVGHALNNTLQDVLVRFERMRGKDVLWQVGLDHAGIATQLVVERQLAERQQSRVKMGREKFLEAVWKWKDESGGAIVGQLRRLGASCDWTRERFTMDEGLSRAVLKTFVELYREGLIYKDKRLVNWDPRLQTAVSDLEVESIEVKGHLWNLRYPIEGEAGRFITVATTRPRRCSAIPRSRCIPTIRAIKISWASACSCRLRIARSPSSRMSIPIPRKAPAPSRSRPATTSTISRSASVTTCR